MTADIKTDIANEAVRIVTGARRSAYGRPENNFRRIARLWNSHLRNVGIIADEPGALQMCPRDVAAFMRLMKEARLAETPDHRDSFVDLVGYALCGAEVAGVSVSEPAPIEPAPEADGWIAWEGGEMPVPGDMWVEYRMRSVRAVGKTRAGSLDWGRSGESRYDIVAYRVVKS